MDDPDVIDAWRALLADQHGIVSRVQALRNGITDAAIGAHVSGSRWARVGHGVLCTTTGPLTIPARHQAALVSVGPPAALSHRTAGRLWGMVPGELPADERCEITVEYGRSARPRSDLILHRSRAFEHIVVEHDGLPVVNRAHTAIDLAVAEPDPVAAMRKLIHLALAGHVRPEELAAAIENRRPRRYRRACEAAVSLLRDGVTSELESRYAIDVERAHDLPTARRQHRFRLDDGVVAEDCVYACPAGLVIVRLDGHRYHADRAARLRDRRRGNAAEVAGRARLEYGWEEIAGAPCRTAQEVASVLRAHGWDGSVGACRRCRLAAPA